MVPSNSLQIPHDRRRRYGGISPTTAGGHNQIPLRDSLTKFQPVFQKNTLAKLMKGPPRPPIARGRPSMVDIPAGGPCKKGQNVGD